MIEKKILHPLAKINLLPRLIAAYSLLLMAAMAPEGGLFELPGLIVLIISVPWPLIAFQASKKWPAKRTELINMHIDTILSGCVFLIAPAKLILFTVVILSIANATFVGSLKLASSVAALLILLLLTGYTVSEWEFIILPASLENAILAFVVLYFTLFTYKGFGLVKKVIALNRRVVSLSNTDPLTGCFNRLYLDNHLPQEIKKSYRINYPLSLVFADLDHFKNINDTYGHSAGDDVLKAFIEMSNECIRVETDWVARFGGEEFILVLANANLEQSKAIAERIRRQVESHPFIVDNVKIHVTCSFGISSTKKLDNEINAELLIKSADTALYKAKNSGRNRIHAAYASAQASSVD